MTIYHISAECFPVAKVGGLADVVGALPKYQNNLGHQSCVIMPFYDNKFTQNNTFESVFTATFLLGNEKVNFRVLKLKNKSLDFNIFLVDIPELLFTNNIYSNDDTNRFIAFQIAVLQWISQMEVLPDIIHCHDHHVGLMPFMMSHADQFKSLKRVPSVFTIHNAQYQGQFSHSKENLIPEFDKNLTGLLDWDEQINPLATAIKCAWRVTTVSPSYMNELMYNAKGLESLLSSERNKCIGILNGIDDVVWNPKTDGFLIKNYSKKTVISGKKANKQWLCKTFGLDEKLPLYIFIGRLVYEKGADLLSEIFDISLQDTQKSILLLGSGDQKVERGFEQLKEKYAGYFNAFIGYDERLSHIMYAGGDFLLMPSRIEPCGLNQMYSLRYGTIPIVHKVGGLKDTVTDINDHGFGFCHEGVSAIEVSKAISRANAFYARVEDFRKTLKRIMDIDHSWQYSAKQYIRLYNELIKLK